jgi:hypothetical protein
MKINKSKQNKIKIKTMEIMINRTNNRILYETKDFVHAINGKYDREFIKRLMNYLDYFWLKSSLHFFSNFEK